MRIFLIILVFISSAVLRAEDEVLVEKTGKKEVEATEAIEKTAEIIPPEMQKRWALLGSFAYLDTWLPGKLGATLSYGNKERTWEFAYQNASYSLDVLIDDLGKITDTRMHLSTRSHTWGGSFNFQYGIFYNKFSAKLGNDYTELVGASFNLVEIETAGVLWGVGNKWRWGGWELNADWFKVFWPLAKLGEDSDILDSEASSSDKDDIEELIDGVSSIPTVSLAHFELGYRF